MTNVEELQSVQAALDEVRRRLPPTPEVDAMQPELYVDSTGQDAARITVVLGGEPKAGTYSWQELKPIHDLIFDAFEMHDIARWPYIDFRLKSESAAEGDSGEDAQT